MKIVIPMAGMGKRFSSAGYKIPKTLIEVEGAPVVEHVIKRFSSEDQFLFGINEEHERTTPIRSILQKLAPKNEIVVMPYQKGGPILTVNHMTRFLRDGEPVIVNYCDFSWVWDYEDFKRKVAENDCDGAVICYRGFHPHLLGPNKYATLDADGNWMKEIREKYSWYENKQQDWTSSGTYYFKKGSYIKKYFKAIEARKDWLINDEHYVSQIYQLMKEDGLKIFIYEIPVMLQWGTPEDLEEYLYWSRYFRCKESAAADMKIYDMQSLILMAGAGKRFLDAGYKVPKPFISVAEGMMVERSALSLPKGNPPIFVTRDLLRDELKEAQLRNIFKGSKIFGLKELTEGQAATALAAKQELVLDKPLLIGACDHQIFYNGEKFKNLTGESSGEADALIFTYRNNPNVRRNPNAYAWVDADSSGKANRVSVKQPLPGNLLEHHAIIGSFWFRKAGYFTEHAERMMAENRRINNEFYIDEVMNGLIRSGLNVRVFEVDAYASWGTPDDLKTYEYWREYFSKHVSLPLKIPAVSAVIPAYNEDKNLADLIGRIRVCVETRGIQSECEWILVDNGSQDKTWDLLVEQVKGLSYIKPVRILKNEGYGHGILEGLKHGKGRLLAWTHADCQTDPDDIYRALEIYEKEFPGNAKGIVKGSRRKRGAADQLFSWGMQIWASLMLGVQLNEINAQPKLFPRSLYLEMKNPPVDFSLDLYLLYIASKKGYTLREFPVYFTPRLRGEAKGGGGSVKNRWKLIRRTLAYILELRERFRREGI